MSWKVESVCKSYAGVIGSVSNFEKRVWRTSHEGIALECS